MSVDRRDFLKAAAVAGTAAAVAPQAAQAREQRVAPPDAIGMLYDATKCIGCKACVVACKEANKLPIDDRYMGDGLYDAPTELNARTKNIIKLYREGERISFMKAQCMHCIDPGCVNACMMGSFKKREHGVVTWLGDRCVGCRYCGIACPYGVPTYEYEKAWPRVVKCEMCADREGKPFVPACCEVCPRQAVIAGSYTELLAEAKRRIAENPDRYEPKVFGETDGGGTQVLYLSAAGVPFEKLGLPDIGPEPAPDLQRTIQHGLYQGAVIPAALFAVFAGAVWRSRRQQGGEKGGES
jgi:Fe-S-cluster-containing dehydrogenase component